MDIGSILLILTLLLLVGMFISRPLFERKTHAVSWEEQEISTLLAERDRILSALKELDFDHVLGKIPEEDYPIQRSTLLQRGVIILRQIDDLRGGDEAVGDINERIETAIAARRAGSSVQNATSGYERGIVTEDDEIEALIAARRRARSEKAAGFCPRCGGPVQISDRFCPKCGTSLV